MMALALSGAVGNSEVSKWGLSAALGIRSDVSVSHFLRDSSKHSRVELNHYTLSRDVFLHERPLDKFSWQQEFSAPQMTSSTQTVTSVMLICVREQLHMVTTLQRTT